MLKSATLFFVLGMVMVLAAFVTITIGKHPYIWMVFTFGGVMSILWGLAVWEENPHQNVGFLNW